MAHRREQCPVSDLVKANTEITLDASSSESSRN
jgi:hypothetical protein